MWQEIIVGVSVLAAFAFLLKQWLPVFKKTSGSCHSGCGDCGSASNVANNNTDKSCSKY